MEQSSGQGAGLAPLVNFYSKLPKGAAPTTAGSGIKARFFNGKNASAAPVLFTILGIFGLGYTIDYQSAYIPYGCVFWDRRGADMSIGRFVGRLCGFVVCSAPE